MKLNYVITLLILGLCLAQAQTPVFAQQLISSTRLTEEGAEISAYGDAFRVYELQFSYDLTNWNSYRRVAATNAFGGDGRPTTVNMAIVVPMYIVFPSNDYTHGYQNEYEVQQCPGCTLHGYPTGTPMAQCPPGPSQAAFFRFVGHNPTNWFSLTTERERGTNCVFRLFLTDCTDLGGVTTEVDFDPSQITPDFNYLDIGPFLSESGKVNVSVFGQMETKGRMMLSVSRLGGMKGVSGSGEVMSIRFNIRDSGRQPNITLSRTALSAVDGTTKPRLIECSQWQNLIQVLPGR